MQIDKIQRGSKLCHFVRNLVLGGVEALEMYARITDIPMVEFEQFPVNSTVGFINNAAGIA